MNLYFLLEGKSTERRVYRAWLAAAFPQLTEVHRLAEVQTDNFYMFSTDGQPAIFTAIDDTIADLCARPIFDHLFICLDVEDSRREDVRRQVLDAIDASTAVRNQHLHAPQLRIHPILQDCCIESWFLGNTNILPPEARTEPLKSWQQSYDVRTRDPERMPAFNGYNTRAQFHYEYLRAAIKDRSPRLNYSKTMPGPVMDPTYLAALVRRHRETGHIASFGELVRVWGSLGATFTT